VNFESGHSLRFGQILEILMINENYYFLIEQFNSVLEDNFIHTTEDEHLNNCLKKNFKKFFDKIDLNQKEIVLVEIEKILSKCVFLAMPETGKAWISPCFNLDEHD
jgi:hypothetical protein